MHCIVTAGPTYEPLDQVRRLTNFSTGRLGTELASFLAARGHAVTLLLGEQATHRGERAAQRVDFFTTSEDLRGKFRALTKQRVDAIFHAAAVGDFAFGKIWRHTAAGRLRRIAGGKISTRAGRLLVELRPTPKLIAELRELFPAAKLVGWKYEVDGDRAGVLATAERQLRECRTDACVANGPAFGLGFGLVTGPGKCRRLREPGKLFSALERLVVPKKMSPPLSSRARTK
jgi:phosphopantothenoylcysteine decarboxylase/phosphopantothenate--cysteine ligase